MRKSTRRTTRKSPITTLQFRTTKPQTKIQDTKYTGNKNLLGIDIKKDQKVAGYEVSINGEPITTKWLPLFAFHKIPTQQITLTKFESVQKMQDGVYWAWTDQMQHMVISVQGNSAQITTEDYDHTDPNGDIQTKPIVVTQADALQIKQYGIRWIATKTLHSPTQTQQPTPTNNQPTKKDNKMPKSKFDKVMTSKKKEESPLSAEHASAVAEFKELRDQMQSAFIKRDLEINMLLLSFVMKQHCLLLGAAGTAKSMLTQVFATATQAAYGRKLFHKFLTMEDLFGIVDVQAYVNKGEYNRISGQGIQDKEIVFADEIFKATTVLQSMLTILEERQYDKNGVLSPAPLEMCVGASNEYPEDSSLDALYDRFLMRRWIGYLDNRADRRDLLTMSQSPSAAVTKILSPESIVAMRGLFSMVTIPDSVIEALLNIVDTLTKESIKISDRRMVKLLSILKASAALDGRMEANTSDLTNLIDAMWDRHTDRATVENAVMEEAVDPSIAMAERFIAAANEVYTTVEHIVQSQPTRDSMAIENLSTASDKLNSIIDEMESVLDDRLEIDDFVNSAGIQAVYDMDYNITRWIDQSLKSGRRRRRQ